MPYNTPPHNKHVKGKSRRRLVGVLHNAALSGRKINEGVDVARQIEIRKSLLGEANSLMRSVNYGRKIQELKPLSIGELVKLLQDRNRGIFSKAKRPK